ncbi:MAG: hypothetical protein KKE39_02845 [Bacteroidetes bacterium]|nr:hypothetical protein [Bacteroidota bacterium]MBU1372863.1 hypothetical protein [Bacteroidota bacterium]MBU1485592.1 hypothetical protein [Bacteroidota bacterium]MBU1759793.1 hypothetical protein [Bacteroidota bacterium]MBU2046818.1 hypothetical protein [Bacteroidota bacterium]
MNPEELLGQNDGQQAPQESPLISLKKDLEFYKDTIKEVAVEIMVEGLSAYPIFIAHQHEIALGELILDHKELGTNWTIQASTLEEFQEKGIVQSNKKDAFLQSYKPADDFMCVFVVVPEGANFVYFPYK